MSSEKVIQHSANGLSTSVVIAIGIGVVLLLVFAAKSVDMPVGPDLTGGLSATPVVEDWKGNSGSIPQRPRSLQ